MNKELKEIIEKIVLQLMRNGDDMVGTPNDTLEVINYSNEFWELIENELDNDKEFEGYKNLKTEIHKYANDCFDKLLDEYEENK
jgi:hypothetical protein